MELEALVESRCQHRASVVDGQADDNEIRGSSARATTSRCVAARGRVEAVGAEVADGCASSPGSATRRPAGSVPGLVRARARDERDGRGAAVRDARRVRHADGGAVRALEGGRRHRARAPVRLRRRGAPPVALRGRVLPGARSPAASTRARRSSGPTSSSSALRTFDGIGLESGPSSDAATSSPGTASRSTPSASTSTGRATCGCSRTSSTTPTGRTRCSTSRPRGLRPRLRPVAPLAPPRGPPDRDGGHGDHDGEPRPGGGLAP